MTDEEMAEEYAKLNARQYIHNDGIGFCTSEEEVKQAFLAGLKAGRTQAQKQTGYLESGKMKQEKKKAKEQLKKTKFRASKVKFIWNEALEGKRGYVANNINELREIIEGKCCADITTVHQSEHDALPFKDDIGSENRFFYLVK